MTGYIGILEKEPGTLWGIWFPDLIGCIAAADTAEETLAQAEDALAQWLELNRDDGLAIPAPRGIEALRAEPEFAEALAAGHVAVVVRPSMDELDFDEATLRAIDRVAESRGLSRSGLVRELVLNQIVT